MSKVNFHAHTIYCHHSTNQPRELIELAIQKGYKQFGISEHIELFQFTSARPSVDECHQLFQELKLLKEEYKAQIEIFIGLESECHPEAMTLIKQWYDHPDVDFIIYGNHIYDVIDGKFKFLADYCDDAVIDKQIACAELAATSGMFSYFCHPDRYLKFYGRWDDEAQRLADTFIDLAIKYNMPLEINVSGYRTKLKNKDPLQYPCDAFWDRVSQSNAPVIIGLDTHDLDLLNDVYYNEICNYVKQHNLEKNLVHSLKLKNKVVQW